MTGRRSSGTRGSPRIQWRARRGWGRVVGGESITGVRRPAPEKTTTVATIPACLGRPSTRDLTEMERGRWRSLWQPRIRPGRSGTAAARVGGDGDLGLARESETEGGRDVGGIVSKEGRGGTTLPGLISSHGRRAGGGPGTQLCACLEVEEKRRCCVDAN